MRTVVSAHVLLQGGAGHLNDVLRPRQSATPFGSRCSTKTQMMLTPCTWMLSDAMHACCGVLLCQHAMTTTPNSRTTIPAVHAMHRTRRRTIVHDDAAGKD